MEPDIPETQTLPSRAFIPTVTNPYKRLAANDVKDLDLWNIEAASQQFASMGLGVQGQKYLELMRGSNSDMEKHHSSALAVARNDAARILRFTDSQIPSAVDQLVEKYTNNGVFPMQQLEMIKQQIAGIKQLPPQQQLLAYKKLVQAVMESDMVFAVGPAGTGKTYTAVAMAVRALKAKEVKRIILTRPAVEAGENLGFLPGDLKEKLDPYLMPLYDALRDMIPAEKLADMIEFGVIEIAPLAFMRGRTLDKAFVILDEAQNTTQMQMKMFLTRMGMTAKFVITGDMSQVDLPSRQRSGLSYALDVLKDIDEIKIVRLGQSDVIRHRLVKQIIQAFDVAEHQEKIDKQAKKDQQEKQQQKNS
jgi:phosphate starvation-inducible protein PhoH